MNETSTVTLYPSLCDSHVMHVVTKKMAMPVFNSMEVLNIFLIPLPHPQFSHA